VEKSVEGSGTTLVSPLELMKLGNVGGPLAEAWWPGKSNLDEVQALNNMKLGLESKIHIDIWLTKKLGKTKWVALIDSCDGI